MSFGYLGDTSTKIKQQVKNQGVISVSEAYELEKAGHLGGSLELIEEQTVSGVSAVNFTSIKESVYDVHFLKVCYYQATSSSYMNLRFYESGVLETASVYQKALQYQYWGGTNGENKSTSETQLFTGAEATTGQIKGNCYVYIYNAGDSAKYTSISLHAANGGYTTFGGGVMTQASVVDGFNLTSNGGYNFTSKLKLYGVKQ